MIKSDQIKVYCQAEGTCKDTDKSTHEIDMSTRLQSAYKYPR